MLLKACFKINGSTTCPPQSSLDALRVASPMDLRRAGFVVGVLAFALAVITGEKTDLRLCSSPLSSIPRLFRVALSPHRACAFLRAVPSLFLQTWDLTPSTALPSHRRTVPFRRALHLGPPPLYLPWPWRAFHLSPILEPHEKAMGSTRTTRAGAVGTVAVCCCRGPPSQPSCTT